MNMDVLKKANNSFGNRVLVYGIDKYSEFIISSIKKTNEIVGITDSYSNLSSFGELTYIKNIKDVVFDYIVITARDRGIRDEIMTMLQDEGVSKNTIVSFWELFHEDKLTKVINNHPSAEYNGMIVGLSHAAYGINPKYLNGNWVNLATSSEDLFYHYEVLKRCFSAYRKNFQNVQYVLLDMYDYNFFVCDTSMSSYAISYWICGGVPVLHNYELNPNYNIDIEYEMGDKYKHLPAYFPQRTENELMLRSKLFDEKKVYKNISKYMADIGPINSGYDDFPNEFSNCGHIEKVPKVPATALIRTSNQEKYKKTEIENQQIFFKIMELMKTEIPSARVILTLIPRYQLIERIHSESKYMNDQKTKFMNNISNYINDKNVDFLDLKSQSDISGNCYLYRDEQHLNYQGSIALTSIYADYIDKKC